MPAYLNNDVSGEENKFDNIAVFLMLDKKNQLCRYLVCSSLPVTSTLVHYMRPKNVQNHDDRFPVPGLSL